MSVVATREPPARVVDTQTARAVSWPEGRRFAFTIFDDPDGQTVEMGKRAYGLLAELGFRTTRGVWPGATVRTPNSTGMSCENIDYRRHTQELQALGFEVGYHNHTRHSSTRDEIVAGLDAFRDYFGYDPASMANHYNADAMYWGPERLTPPTRTLYLLATAGRRRGRHFGHVPGHPSFWGDVCRERIRYCRNFVYRNVNTLAVCPCMPYYDPDKPLVNAWYASTEGANVTSFVNALSEVNQDRLETEGGACIMYTHFGHGFVSDGVVLPRFERLMRRLSAKRGWFVPVAELLDYLRSLHGLRQIDGAGRRRLEMRWLGEKLLRGTS